MMNFVMAMSVLRLVLSVMDELAGHAPAIRDTVNADTTTLDKASGVLTHVDNIVDAIMPHVETFQSMMTEATKVAAVPAPVSVIPSSVLMSPQSIPATTPISGTVTLHADGTVKEGG